jgi:hypothetical protein
MAGLDRTFRDPPDPHTKVAYAIWGFATGMLRSAFRLLP